MIKYIRLSDITSQNILENYIYNNKEDNYYFTDDYSIEMYDALAFAGFISVTHTNQNTNDEFLLPEMQFSYAVLHFDNLHMPKRLKKFINKYIINNDNYYITINKNLDSVINQIKKYHKDINWLTDKYINTLKECRNSNNELNCKTKIISVELWDKNKLVAGEIGYINGSIYTSLTGFFDKENYSNFGKIQLVALALILKKSEFTFWNMGHPYMDYKFKMGAVEYQREYFLKNWEAHHEDVIDFNISGKKFKCTELFEEFFKINSL